MADATIRFKEQGSQQTAQAVEALREKFRQFQAEVTGNAFGAQPTQAVLGFQQRVAELRNEIDNAAVHARSAKIALDVQPVSKGWYDFRQELEKVNTDLGQTQQLAQTTGGALSGASGGGRFQGFTQAAAGVSALGAVTGQTQLAAPASGALRLIDATTKLNETMAAMSLTTTGLTVSMSAFIVVGAAAALALKTLSDGVKDVQEQVKVQNDEIERQLHFRDLQSNSYEDLKSRSEDLQYQIDLEIQARDNLIKSADESLSGMSNLEKGLVGVSQATGIGGNKFDEYIDSVGKFNQSIAAKAAELDAITAQLLPIAESREQQEKIKEVGRQLGDEFIQGVEEGLDIEERVREIAEMSLEGARKAELETEQQTKDLQSEIDSLNQRIAENRQNYADLTAQLERGELTQEQFIQQSALLNGIELSLVERLTELQAEYDQQAQLLEKIRDTAIPAAQALEQYNNAIKANEELLKKENKALDDLNKQRDSDLKTLAKINADIAKFNEEETKRKRDTSRNAQIAALQDQISQAKANEASQKQLLQQRQKEQDINTKYMEDELKRTQKFALDEKRLEEDHAREMIELAENLNNDLKSLAVKNDVIGFLARQTQGETAISQSARRFGIGASRRAEDFALAGEEARQQREQALAEIHQTQQQALTQSQQLEAQLNALRQQFREEDLANETNANARRIQKLYRDRLMLENELTYLDSLSLAAGKQIAQHVLKAMSDTFYEQIPRLFGSNLTNNVNNSVSIAVNNPINMASQEDLQQLGSHILQEFGNVTFGSLH